MRSSRSILAVCLASAAVVVATVVLSPARTDAQDKSPAAGAEAAKAAAFDYVGIKKCRMCHVDQFGSFDALPKANAWEALKANVGAEVKKKAGLDPAADYTRDSRCLTCHATGFGEPGGYAIPDPTSKVAVALAASREGVGCESCHGPGSGFFERMRDIHQTERTYRREELLTLGLRPTASDTCDKCHNADALCLKGRTDLKVDPKDRRGYHAEFPLQRRDPTDKPNPAGGGR